MNMTIEDMRGYLEGRILKTLQELKGEELLLKTVPSYDEIEFVISAYKGAIGLMTLLEVYDDITREGKYQELLVRIRERIEKQDELISRLLR